MVLRQPQRFARRQPTPSICAGLARSLSCCISQCGSCRVRVRPFSAGSRVWQLLCMGQQRPRATCCRPCTPFIFRASSVSCGFALHCSVLKGCSLCCLFAHMLLRGYTFLLLLLFATLVHILPQPSHCAAGRHFCILRTQYLRCYLRPFLLCKHICSFCMGVGRQMWTHASYCRVACRRSACNRRCRRAPSRVRV